MLARSSLRAGARMTAVAVAMAICAGSTLARAPSQVQPVALEPIAPVGEPVPTVPVQLASLEPVALPIEKPAVPIKPTGPFGLASAGNGSFSARWRILQPSIRVERQILAVCRSNPNACPAAAAKFGAIVDSARARSGLARVGEVNRAVNLAIRPVDDLVQYGAPDIWASPLMTFGSGAGDCEDYAIAKYVALLEAGMASDDLRLVVVDNRAAHESHMVAAARIEGRWLILDNRTMRLVSDNESADYTPLAMLDSVDPSPTVAAAPLVEPSAESWTAEGFTVAL
jgi:predicted transglutaminase-like cysteine proteinase